MAAILEGIIEDRRSGIKDKLFQKLGIKDCCSLKNYTWQDVLVNFTFIFCYTR